LSTHLQKAESEAMTDQQIDELLQRAADGEYEAQARVDAWIAEALGPVCATAPMEIPERSGTVIGYDRLECCCGGA
jgi:hypothetical protein